MAPISPKFLPLTGPAPVETVETLTRRRLPDTRESVTRKFLIHGETATYKYYVNVGFFANGEPGEIFVRAAGPIGSSLREKIDMLSIEISHRLQLGEAVEKIVERYSRRQFDAGETRSEFGYVKSPIELAVRYALALRERRKTGG